MYPGVGALMYPGAAGSTEDRVIGTASCPAVEEGMVRSALATSPLSIAGHDLLSNSPGVIVLMIRHGDAGGFFLDFTCLDAVEKWLVEKRRSVQIISVPAFLHLAHGRKSLHLALLSLHGTHAAAALERWAIRRALWSSAS